jgi:hypothetical protein
MESSPATNSGSSAGRWTSKPGSSVLLSAPTGGCWQLGLLAECGCGPCPPARCRTGLRQLRSTGSQSRVLSSSRSPYSHVHRRCRLSSHHGSDLPRPDLRNIANDDSDPGHCVLAQPRVTRQTLMGARVSQAAPLGDASLLTASATGAVIAAFSWQPAFRGVTISAEVGRMTSRFGERRDPKYGRLLIRRQKRMS